MDYIFGHITRDGVDVENVKTVGAKHSNLSGSVSVTRKYSDSYITDSFFVSEKYRSEEGDNGTCYDWYLIERHTRYEDKYTPQIGATEQEITELEIENIEQEQALTDAEIAIIELQERIGE